MKTLYHTIESIIIVGSHFLFCFWFMLVYLELLDHFVGLRLIVKKVLAIRV